MNNSIDYNVFNLSLNNGLENHAISSGKDYIILLKAPVNANVRVRLNSNQGDLIPLKENYAIKASNVKEIFISADIVENQVITIGQSNSVDGFEIITAPTINSIEEIGKIKIIEDIFAPKNSFSQTITSGNFYELNTNILKQVRFFSSDELGVDILSNGIKYPMIEDLINLRNLDTNVKFYNDTASSINVTFWTM